ncbi:hypothetical protein [Tabrizicola sp.]|uniref:hypothetical protein n=1 Tax=Tabrizicola sp. TaxID=2005166 RepID=UPI003F310023
MSASVSCATHGSARPAFACVHVLETLRDQKPRGLFFDRDDDDQLNGWCAECEAVIAANNYEWTDDIVARMNGKLLCEACFLDAMRLNNVSEVS